MTDKHIVYYKKDCFNEPYCSLKEVIEELSRKTQECEEALKQLEFVRTHNTVLCSEINQLKAENDLFRTCHDNEQAKRRKYEQTITEIKEIAQYDVYTSRTDLCLKLNWIKKKISECEVENDT